MACAWSERRGRRTRSSRPFSATYSRPTWIIGDLASHQINQSASYIAKTQQHLKQRKQGLCGNVWLQPAVITGEAGAKFYGTVMCPRCYVALTVAFVMLVLQMKKLRCREMNFLILDHTARS